MEINETPVTIEYTMEEHELLNDILNLEMDAMDVVLCGEMHSLPKDCQIRIRYELLEAMRQRSLQLWSNRFGVES
jgi:hypothetical protein